MPQANAFCERVIGTVRRECLDHLIPLNERHLRQILSAWVPHYNHGRPTRVSVLGFPRRHRWRCHDQPATSFRADIASQPEQFSAAFITNTDSSWSPRRLLRSTAHNLPVRFEERESPAIIILPRRERLPILSGTGRPSDVGGSVSLVAQPDRPDVGISDGPDPRVGTHEALVRQSEVTGQAVVVAHVHGVDQTVGRVDGREAARRMTSVCAPGLPPSTETAQKRSIMKLAGSWRRS